MTAAIERPYPEVILLTGFLGSGKTTLILDYLKDPATRNTGVIVNEVGQVDVDGAVITSQQSGLPLAVLANGCVCCSLRDDLPYTIQALLAEREGMGEEPLDRIIVETSGLSRPAPVMRSLLSIKSPVRTAIISTYDCVEGPATNPRFEEAMAQIAAAQTIVLTKTDRAEAAATAKAAETAAYLNPLARIVSENDRTARARSTFTRATQPLTELPATPRHKPHRPEHDRAHVFLVRVQGKPTWGEFVEWVENLAGLCGERLLRAKGLVRIADCEQPILIQGVGTTFDPPRIVDAGPDHESALVVIGRDLSADDLSSVEPSLDIQVSPI